VFFHFRIVSSAACIVGLLGIEIFSNFRASKKLKRTILSLLILFSSLHFRGIKKKEIREISFFLIVIFCACFLLELFLY